MRRISPSLFCLALIIIAGCEKSNPAAAPPAPEAGEWTVVVKVTTFDEFRREIPPAGLPMRLTLSAKDRTLHAVMDSGASTYAFTALPYQQYLVTVEKEGYYPAQNAYKSSEYNYHEIDIDARLHPLPTPLLRIDSIRCAVSVAVPQVILQLFTPQVRPWGGWRQAVIFAGLTPAVSASYGTYVATIPVEQSVDASYMQAGDVYGALRAGGLAPGMKVYVTARVMTGAATSWRDEQTGVMRYSNLEENTRAVISFIMP